tara:strand:- start:2571 stop:2840 length:270 start_codon:yes stop_codon:yes gene_type:complete
MSKVEQILVERSNTHGDPVAQARTSQALKQLFLAESKMADNRLSPLQKECIDMICLKMSRIATGDADCKDHWDDIAGYATLASNGLGED